MAFSPDSVSVLGSTVEVSELESLSKGSLIVGDGVGAPSTLAVGGDGLVLVADSTQATGIKWASVAGAGDVVGPASGTDNALVRMDSTTGKLIQNSTVILDDTGNLTAVTSITIGNTGLKVFDTDATHTLSIVPGSNLTGNRTLSIITGDANRSLTLSGAADISGTNTGDQTITLTGDVTGSGTGSFAATIANDAVTYAKIQNVSATDKVLGRSTAGAGDIEEITCTAAGRALIDDVDAATQRTTLGLGSIATQNSNGVAITGGTITGITDLAIADGGTGASSATVAFNNLSPLTTKGDVVSHNGTNNIRVAVGSNGQVLTADSAQASGVKWATPAVGDVVGPASATDSSIPLFDTTTGKLLKASDIIVDSSENVSGVNSITLNTAGSLRTATSDTNTLLIQAYDVDGTAYTTFATLTAGNTPTMDLSDSVTKSGQYIYRASGTDVAIADGGTGASTATAGFDNLAPTTTRGDIIYRGASNNSRLAVGGSGTVLKSNGTDPSWGQVLLTADVSGALPIANGGTGQTTATAGFDALAPTTTKGDIIAHNGTNNIRLAAGTNGKVLSANSAQASGLEWITAGTGDVVGPASALDNAIVRYDTTTGKLVQGSSVLIDDTDNITGVASIAIGNTGLKVLDTDASHTLAFIPGSNLTANRTLTVTTGDANRTLTLSGDATITGSNTGDQTITLTGDVTGSGTGSFSTTISADSVTYGKIQNVSATDKVLGRSSVGSGDIEEIACTAAGRALIDDADAAAQRTTLGLGTLALQAANSVSITGGSITGITDLAVADGGTGASDAATARTNLGAAASGANTDLTSVYLNNTGLKIKDTNASHGLIIAPGSDITADRTLSLVTGDASRTITLAGNLDLGGDFSTSGTSAVILTSTASTNVTLPTTGTLSTLAGSETLSNKTLTAPKFASGGYLADANGNELLILTTTASAVNELTLANAATGNGPLLSATGGDTDVDFHLRAKGAGLVKMQSTGGNVQIGGGATASELRLMEPSGSGTNYTAFVAQAQAANLVYTLPAAHGTNGLLKNDGSGGLSWSTTAGTGDVVGPASAADNTLVRFDGTTGKLIQASDIVIDDSENVSLVNSLTLNAGGSVRTSTTATDTLLLQAYDVDGAAYVTFATLTAANTPTMDLSTAVTIGGAAIYRVGGTDVSLADGGTGASLTDPNADRLMFWDDSAGAVDWLTAGTGLTITTTTIAVDTASTTVSGISELAIASEVNTGTDATRSVTPDALAGSYAGTRVFEVVAFDFTTDMATGDGKAYFTIPSSAGGMDLVAVHARVITAGTTGTCTIQIANVTQAADMLTTKISIDSTETGSDTAATPAVIDTTNDDVATNDLIRIDVDTIHTTAAKGLIVTLEFRLP